MLTLNVARLFAVRGIKNPYAFLVKHGISRPTAFNIVKGNVNSLRSNHMELICVLLNCEPNDLYEWTPSAGGSALIDPAKHPLRRLRRERAAVSTEHIADLIRRLPLDKMPDVADMLRSIDEEPDGEPKEN